MLPSLCIFSSMPAISTRTAGFFAGRTMRSTQTWPAIHRPALLQRLVELGRWLCA